MKIDKSAFCNLSNSLKWQTWLSDYDKDMHSLFMNRLRANRGCADNRKLMDDVFDEIAGTLNGEAAIMAFIDQFFPFMILDRSGVDKVVISELIEYFSSPVLTFPHRHIIMSGKEVEVVEYCSDKAVCDYLMSDGYIFVEFLYADEFSILNEIPSKSWLLSKYKVSRRITNGE